MKLIAKEAVLLLSLLLVCAIYAVPMVKAAPDPVTPDSPDPLNVAWFVTDPAGTPIDNAMLTIYWSTSASGPFSAMSSSDVEDKIGGVPPNPGYQNPIITGGWNPTYEHGYALADLHITSVSSYFFYVKIEYDLVTEYWPVATSYKPGDPDWGYPIDVVEAATPSGFAATGNGFGNGITTAYPTQPPPPPVIPEVPFGTIVSFLSMLAILGGFVGVRRFRPKSH